MIEPTDEMKAAVKRRMGVPDGQEMDPWMGAAIEDVLAIVERDRAAEAEAVADVLAAFRASRAKGFSWTRGAVAEALRALDRAMP